MVNLVKDEILEIGIFTINDVQGLHEFLFPRGRGLESLKLAL